MSQARNASDRGLHPHWKVRVVLPGALLHLASFDEPEVEKAQRAGVPLEEIFTVHAQWIDDHRYGDTIGFIDWSMVKAITWRWAE